MTIGEKLLNLTIEYQDSVAARAQSWGIAAGRPEGRDPAEIGAEYATTLRELLS